MEQCSGDPSGCILKMPYKVSLYDGIGIGTVVKFVPDNSDRFNIDLKCTEWSDGDVALRCSPDFDENKVVLNSRQKGVWGKSEYQDGFPFYHGQAFELMIITQQEGFKTNRRSLHQRLYGLGIEFKVKSPLRVVTTDLQDPHIIVGAQEYHSFHFRIPISEVCRLEVSGKVTLESVSIF